MRWLATVAAGAAATVGEVAAEVEVTTTPTARPWEVADVGELLHDFFLRRERPSCPIWADIEFVFRWKSRGVSVISVLSRLRLGIDLFVLSFRSSSRGRGDTKRRQWLQTENEHGEWIGALERAIRALFVPWASKTIELAVHI